MRLNQSQAQKLFLYAAIVIGLALVNVLNITSTLPALSNLFDFGSFVAAGRAVVDGDNPYSADLPLVYIVRSDNSERILPCPNLNPPITTQIFKLIARFDPYQAVNMWRLAIVVQFILALVLLAYAYPNQMTPLRMLWAFSLAGLWNTILLGQIYAVLLLLIICAWIFLERGHHQLAGIALGLMIAIKPNFAFWVLLLAVAGQVKVFLSAAATAALLSTLPVFTSGIYIYQQWLVAASEFPSFGMLAAGNSSLYSLSARFGTTIPGLALSLVLAGGSLYYAYQNKNVLQSINALGIISSLLLFPFSWTGYTMLVLPVFISKPQWNWRVVTSAILLAFPYLLVVYLFNESRLHTVVFGWIYGWGLLLILIEVLVNPHKATTAPTFTEL